MNADTIRPERSFEQFSRGGELMIALRNLWDENDRLSRGLPDRNDRIAANVDALREKFDLTYPEFYMWSRATSRH